MSQHRQQVGLQGALQSWKGQASFEEETSPRLAISWSFQKEQKCHLEGKKEGSQGLSSRVIQGDHQVQSG